MSLIEEGNTCAFVGTQNDGTIEFSVFNGLLHVSFTHSDDKSQNSYKNSNMMIVRPTNEEYWIYTTACEEDGLFVIDEEERAMFDMWIQRMIRDGKLYAEREPVYFRSHRGSTTPCQKYSTNMYAV